jgi:hypothetical protein
MAKIDKKIKQNYLGFILLMKQDNVGWAFCRASGVTVIFKAMPKNNFMQVAVSYCSPDDDFKKKTGLVVAATRWYDESNVIQIPMRYSDKKLAIDNFMRKTLHPHGCEEYNIEWGIEPQKTEWVSNVGHTSDGYQYYPCRLSCDTKIEVKFRNGGTETGIANDWEFSWLDEGQAWDIVAYRVL